MTNPKAVMRIGIIGFGSFGKLIAELLSSHAEVLVYSRFKDETLARMKDVQPASIQEIAQCDAVMIATELASIRSVCDQLKPHVKQGTIVLDVCSVKVRPAAILKEVLGGSCQLLATHPMFGPQSVEDGGGTKDLEWVWHELSEGSFDKLENLLVEKLELKLIKMTPDEHDRQMAWVHGLTFFIGRSLVELGIPKLTLDTGYFTRLHDLYELEKNHSRALFHTIEGGNPYAKEVREKFMNSLEQLEIDIIREAAND